MGTALTVAGYLVGGVVFFWAARGRRLATEGMAWVALAGLVCGVAGARLAEWVLTGALTGTAFLDPRVGGRTILGGVLGGWIGVEAAKALLGIRRSTGDLFALALPAGEAVGRLGCFFNTCCYGTPAELPWSVFQHGAWRHPAQLYAATFAFGAFALLAWLRPRLPREGDLFRAYCVLFGFGRVGVEVFRERDLLAGGLSLAQWVAIAFAVWGGASLLRRRGLSRTARAATTTEASPADPPPP